MIRSRLSVLALLAIFAASSGGCAWTKRTWDRIMRKDTTTEQQEVKADPVIVTGSEEPVTSQQQTPASSAPSQTPSATSEPMIAAEPQQPTPAAGDVPPVEDAPPGSVATVEPIQPTLVQGEQNLPPPGTGAKAGGADQAMEEITLQADNLFPYGKSDEASLSAAGKVKLNEIAARLKKMDMATINAIMVIGHADRIGDEPRNMITSAKRATTVKNYLVKRGLDAEMLKVEGRGSTEPKVQCSGNKATKALIACLAPNRRVEISIAPK